MNSRDMIRKARKCESYLDLIEVAKESDIELSKEEALFFFVKANSKMMGDNELEHVVAGLSFDNNEPFRYLLNEVVEFESVIGCDIIKDNGIITSQFNKGDKKYYKINGKDVWELQIIGRK